MSKMLSATLFLLLNMAVFSMAQKPLPFRGSFLMSFSEETAGQKKAWPFAWSVDVAKMAMEIKDDMNKKGVSKRIVYNLTDSTWLMLMSYNKVKQGTRIQARAMFTDTMAKPSVKTRLLKEKKIINGYECRRYIATSENDSASLWVAPDLKFDICRLYQMLSHCGMMSGYVDNGTWYYAKNLKGMVLEAVSVDKKSGASYTMSVSDIHPGEIIASYFDLTGFKISDIPEGASCGPMTKDKDEKE